MTLQDFDTAAGYTCAWLALRFPAGTCSAEPCKFGLCAAWHSKSPLYPSMLQPSHPKIYVLPETMWPVRIFKGLGQGLGGGKGQVRREEQLRCSRYSRVHL